MVQGHRLYGKHRIFQDGKEPGPRIYSERMNGEIRLQKTVGGSECRVPDFLTVEFTDLNSQGIAVNQIPGVPAKLTVHIVDQSRRTIEAKRFSASQSHSHDGVEADEVVHVRMGDEEVAGPKQTRGAQRGVLPEVEKQRPFRPAHFHIDARIAEAVVHQVAGEGGGHRLTSTPPAPHYTQG